VSGKIYYHQELQVEPDPHEEPEPQDEVVFVLVLVLDVVVESPPVKSIVQA